MRNAHVPLRAPHARVSAIDPELTGRLAKLVVVLVIVAIVLLGILPARG
jgi:hypothetical protein